MRAFIMGLLVLCASGCRPQSGPPPRTAKWLDNMRPLPSMRHLRDDPLRLTDMLCGFPLRVEAVLPDPDRVPDRDGEWVDLQHHEVEVLNLAGWVLESGGRMRPLGPKLLPPGDRLRVGGVEGALRPIQLRNRGGVSRLLDPCGLEISRLEWGLNSGPRLKPGEWLARHPMPVHNARTPPEVSQAGFPWWLRMDLNHRPNDYESFALTPELRSRWGLHLASRSHDRQPRTPKKAG